MASHLVAGLDIGATRTTRRHRGGAGPVSGPLDRGPGSRAGAHQRRAPGRRAGCRGDDRARRQGGARGRAHGRLHRFQRLCRHQRRPGADLPLERGRRHLLERGIGRRHGAPARGGARRCAAPRTASCCTRSRRATRSTTTPGFCIRSACRARAWSRRSTWLRERRRSRTTSAAPSPGRATRVEKLILEPLAAARAVLREDEREIGVAVLDLGGATSQMAIFVDGRPYYTDMLPTGGVALTWDLVQHLHIQHEEARRVLENHGCALAELVGSRDMIEIPGPTPSRPRRIGRATVADALENRLTAIVAWCQRELNARELIAPLGTGVVPHRRRCRPRRYRRVGAEDAGDAGSHRHPRRRRKRVGRLDEPLSALHGRGRGAIRSRSLCQDGAGGACPHPWNGRKGWCLAQGVFLSTQRDRVAGVSSRARRKYGNGKTSLQQGRRQ